MYYSEAVSFTSKVTSKASSTMSLMAKFISRLMTTVKKRHVPSNQAWSLASGSTSKPVMTLQLPSSRTLRWSKSHRKSTERLSHRLSFTYQTWRSAFSCGMGLRLDKLASKWFNRSKAFLLRRKQHRATSSLGRTKSMNFSTSFTADRYLAWCHWALA